MNFEMRKTLNDSLCWWSWSKVTSPQLPSTIISAIDGKFYRATFDKVAYNSEVPCCYNHDRNTVCRTPSHYSWLRLFPYISNISKAKYSVINDIRINLIP